MTSAFEIILIIAVSLALGSFLNVVIHRLPKGESIVSPPSRCPSCKKRIRFYDNIPLFSFLILNGKCRSCGAPISWRYPVVEALTALSIMALYAVYGLTSKFAAYGILTLFLIPIGFIDLDTGFIPDKLTIPAFIIGIFFIVAFHLVNWKNALFGALAGGALLVLFMVVGKIFFKKDAMGMGDVKLLVLIGVYVGFPEVWIALFFGAFSASILILIGMARKKIRLQCTLPFGPFIAFGTLVYLLGGETLIQWYLRLF
jgi:leader peptidase (prepilin peptidase)/N-methyltransferase